MSMLWRDVNKFYVSIFLCILFKYFLFQIPVTVINMDKERECGCKGRRTCLWCEKEYNLSPDFSISKNTRENCYIYCSKCDKAWPGWVESDNPHSSHHGESIPYSGILVIENFLSEEDVNNLMNGIDEEPWDVSQSGRRKQNYGPKCNFKRKKISKGNFYGFPKFSLFVQNKLREVPLLKEYYVIEQCSLEYDPLKGASIDPHIDDCWIWGERIVTVNVIGDSVLTMLPYKGDLRKYNLDLVSSEKIDVNDNNFCVRIPMPARSIIVLFGDARYNWEHCVLREDINDRRVCLAYREFTSPYLPNGIHSDSGEPILNISKLSLNEVI